QSRSRRKFYRIGLAVGLWTLAAILLCRKELSETRGAVAAITAMAAVTLLLGWGIAGRLRRSEAGLLQVCILISMLLHAGVGSALGTWKIVQSFRETPETGVLETLVDGDTLALERLSMRLREEAAPSVKTELPTPVSPLPAAPDAAPEPLAGSAEASGFDTALPAIEPPPAALSGPVAGL